MSIEYPCIYFEKDGLCRKFTDGKFRVYCGMGPCPEQKLSNADKIRAMSDEELAEFLEDWDFCYSYCPQGMAHSPFDPDCSQGCAKELLVWLQQLAEEETP